MSGSTSPMTRHLEEALEHSDPEEIRFHVRQAMQYAQAFEGGHDE